MYPRLLRRIQGILIDSLIFAIALALSIFIAGYLKLENDYINAAILLLPALSIDPFLITFTGGTIGHHLIGLQVRKQNKDENINLVFAYIRTFFKIILGTPSLIFVLTTKRHQAIHDIVSRSVVVVKNPDKVAFYEALPERVVDTQNYIYPGVFRRLIVIFGYFILFFIAISILMGFVLSDACVESIRCNNIDTLFSLIVYVIFWVGVFVIPAYGWTACLYGCRRIKK